MKKRTSGEKYGYDDGARLAQFGRGSAWIRANPIEDKPIVTVSGTACSDSPITEDVNGKIALITRGGCGFTDKVKAAQDAGAIAVVVKNNVAGAVPVKMTGEDGSITIPAVMVSKAYGDSLSGRTGVLVNNGAGVAQGQGSIAVDGVDATTKFSVDDHVYKADGTDVGVVTTVTATLLTFGANTLAAVNNDDHLHAGIGIGEYAVH